MLFVLSYYVHAGTLSLIVFTCPLEHVLGSALARVPLIPDDDVFALSGLDWGRKDKTRCKSERPVSKDRVDVTNRPSSMDGEENSRKPVKLPPSKKAAVKVGTISQKKGARKDAAAPTSSQAKPFNPKLPTHASRPNLRNARSSTHTVDSSTSVTTARSSIVPALGAPPSWPGRPSSRNSTTSPNRPPSRNSDGTRDSLISDPNRPPSPNSDGTRDNLIFDGSADPHPHHRVTLMARVIL
eukprot:g51749.t1